MSIPAEPSLLQNEVQILNAKPRKYIVFHWIWWWQRLAAWHCKSVWSLPCHSSAEVGGLILSMAKSNWHGALSSAHKSCTHGHVSWKRGDVKRELVAAPWTSSRRFSHMLWLKVHSHLLLRACLLGSKRKLPPSACQVGLGLPSVVCHPRGVQFPGILYICSQGPLSSAWAHCISCAPSACSRCRRCCCCPLQCDRWRMKTCQRAEYWALVNTDLHFKLFTVPFTNMDMALRICIHPLHQSTPLHQVFSAPTRWPSEVLNQKPSPGPRNHVESLVGS